MRSFELFKMERLQIRLWGAKVGTSAASFLHLVRDNERKHHGSTNSNVISQEVGSVHSVRGGAPEMSVFGVGVHHITSSSNAEGMSHSLRDTTNYTIKIVLDSSFIHTIKVSLIAISVCYAILIFPYICGGTLSVVYGDN